LDKERSVKLDQLAKKVIPVAVVKKNILAIQTSGDDMMNGAGNIESSVSKHASMATIC
jgi:hypothetical protein